MDRRQFVTAGLIVGAASVPALSQPESPESVENLPSSDPGLDLSTFPNFCAHEHWGSLASLGHLPEGFRPDVIAGAAPQRDTTLADLLLDPYLGGPLRGAGLIPHAAVKNTLGADTFSACRNHPAKTLRLILDTITPLRLVGIYQCLRRGIRFAYNLDLNQADSRALENANRAVTRNYRDIFTWYSRLMARARFSALIRPVHPEYYYRSASAALAQREKAFTYNVMRIDPLLELWKKQSPRRDGLAEHTGVEPVDAASWRKFLDTLFDRAAQNKALGIKQLQAYSRPLLFEPRSDTEVTFIGDLSPDQVRRFQDWVVHECCRRAHDRRWPHQVHVGTHNHPESNPLPLHRLARRWPHQNIVMLHCWPYLEEAGFLAREHPNIYIDTCWQPVLNPDFLRQSLRRWLAYVPLNKIMLSHDSTSIEMAVGSSLFTREILDAALTEIAPAAGLPPRQRRRFAAGLLHNNAVALYKIGREFNL